MNEQKAKTPKDYKIEVESEKLLYDLYYNGQWTAEEQAILKRRRQNTPVINRISQISLFNNVRIKT